MYLASQERRYEEEKENKEQNTKVTGKYWISLILRANNDSNLNDRTQKK